MNTTAADSVTFRCPYLVHFVHCSLVVMAHSVAASNLLRTRRVQIQQRTFCNNFFVLSAASLKLQPSEPSRLMNSAGNELNKGI